MVLGYFLSCEEYTPKELVEQAVAAERAGFEALWISDHFHPWNDEQGQSPLVWSMIGALSQVTRLPVTTAVTCPIMRQHPTTVAHAAATSSVLLEGRFRLGIGTGEALNEHILGDPWPSAQIRLQMLAESVAIMRELWGGGFVTHQGDYFHVDTARIYTLPENPPEVLMSAFGPEATDVAAEIADGFISTDSDPALLERYREKGGRGTSMAGTKVAYAPSVDEGVQHAHRIWPNSGLPGELAQVLPSPRHFEQASSLVTEESVRESVPAGPDPETHLKAVQEYLDAGYDEVYVANMGPHWAEMITMFGEEVLPHLRGTT